ncbi:MAG: domain S-box protein [Conexibacter sp.]|nr:domain S-box protein [Conexibacter sp.]
MAPAPGAPGELLAALALTTPDAIVTANTHNRITYVNPAAERLLGYTASELVGEPVGKIVPERLSGGHAAGFERFVRTREPRLVGRTVEVPVLLADGTEVPVELSLGVAGIGDDITLTAVIRDVSERVKLARQLSAQLAVTSVLVGEHPAGDTETRIVGALTESLGWDAGALWMERRGVLALAGYWEADAEATSAFAQTCRATTFAPGEGVVGQVWQDAEPMWLERSSEERRFARTGAALASGLQTGVVLPLITEGAVIGVLEVFTRAREPLDERLRDILGTVASQVAESLRRREHAAQLTRSNADLEHFAQMVAHDLSDPLRTINGFAEVILGRYREGMDVKHLEFMQLISRGALRGSRMLDGLLSFARFDTRTLEPARVDLAQVLAEVTAGLRATIEAKQAAIRADALPVVQADPVLLAQVLQNLLANALKFTVRHPPVIDVAAAPADGGWRISVTDNGPGLDPAARAHIFDMFGRGGQSAEDGLGIGLALCAKIVERHGGEIGYDSTPGQGATFFFTLPDGMP